MGQDSFIGKMIYLITEYSSFYIEGIKITLIVAIIGTLCGLLIALFLVVLKSFTPHFKDNMPIKIAKKVLNILATIYIDVVRGTPMLVQAVIFTTGIALLTNGQVPNVLISALIIVSFNTAAYIAEIIRSGINGVGEGQMEAGLSLGLTRFQVMLKVIFPQALRKSLPALSNELIVNIKDSSVLSVIGLTELFYGAKSAASSTMLHFQSYLVAAVIYLILTFTLTRILGLIINGRGNKGKVEISSQTVPEVR